jgi:hypothetical protein
VQKLWQCGEGEDDHMVISFLHGNIGVFVCDCWLQIVFGDIVLMVARERKVFKSGRCR